jgi:GLPGLI family protein
MKKTLLALSFVLIASTFGSYLAMSGKPFEGVITYKITYPDNKFSESQMAMFPKMLTVSIKGTKSRTDLQMSNMNTVTITDYTDKTSVALLNHMGQKYAIKKTSADIEKEMSKETKSTVELTGETKMIAGYNCKKAVISVNDDGVKSTYEVYFTSEMGSKMANFDKPWYKDIDGVLLEFLMINRDITMKFTATSVEKKNLAAKDFEIPSDYSITTPDELKSKFGGGTE